MASCITSPINGYLDYSHIYCYEQYCKHIFLYIFLSVHSIKLNVLVLMIGFVTNYINLLECLTSKQLPILNPESGGEFSNTVDILPHGPRLSVLCPEISSDFSLPFLPVLVRSSYFLCLNKSLISCLSLIQPHMFSPGCSFKNTAMLKILDSFTLINFFSWVGKTHTSV